MLFRFYIYGEINKKTKNNIIKTKGWELNCFEIFYLRQGEYDDPDGKVFYDTEGFGIGSAGLFKLIALIYPQNKTINFFANHLFIQYNQSKLETSAGHPLAGTKFRGINIIIR